jgi:hypothetical protein
MRETNNIFLVKIIEKIRKGDYDVQLNLPFMNQELLISVIKEKFKRKIESGGTPILNDAEIKDCILQVKETAAYTYFLFIKNGLIEQTNESFKLTKEGEIALRIK